MTTQHLEILVEEVGRYAAQIASLSTAANCIFSGGHPVDPLVRENAVLNILDVIEDLAGRAEHVAEHLAGTLFLGSEHPQKRGKADSGENLDHQNAHQ